MPSSTPLRIAILECDTPLPATVTKYGSYGEVFKALLRAGASTLSPPLAESDLLLSAYDVVEQQYPPSLDDIDGILITGSKHSSFDDDPWILKLVDFVRQILAQNRIRIVGVCFGHQIVGRALGVPVGRSPEGWEISVTDLDLTPVGKEIFGQDQIALHQMHRDVVTTYPPGVQVLAHTDKCAVHGMYTARRLMTVQGHPEFNETIVRELLVARHRGGVFDDELFNDAVARVGNKHDGLVVAAAFFKFFLA